MAKDVSPQKPAAEPVKRRISPEIRKAIRLIIRQGMSKTDAAGKVGLAVGSLHNAIARQHVKEHYEAEQALFLQEVEGMRATYRVQAIEVAKDIMHNSKSDTTRMRAVEFFAGESKQAAINVQVNNNLAPSEGYEYVRPGAQIVDITPSTDEPTVVQGPSEPSK